MKIEVGKKYRHKYTRCGFEVLGIFNRYAFYRREHHDIPGVAELRWFEDCCEGIPPEPRKVPVYLYRDRRGELFTSFEPPSSFSSDHKHLATAEFVIPQKKENRHET